ncbi:indole-3-glycerol phosphate synthase TrpC [Kocuria indica]|uniref:Indole-3-glycerol phosphate synthase n=1 Tax=Kocuria marina subsp. indica TaxID=1049583 RepID=A0A6N9R3G4_9MICC|nr:indole-3-glycerol phosphate synthase TrpC [Kocuria indica]NDO79151.1 indole-3-glycerol phosphate synthase TrpC [Kocuria indica]
MSILEDIKSYKITEVADAKEHTPVQELRARVTNAPRPRSLEKSLRTAATRGFGLIAEIKRSSPTRGELRPGLDPADCARAFEAGGAAALSVLTDHRSFNGSFADLTAAREATSMPVLRKDFIVDEYQVLESRARSADAILLIMEILDPRQAADLNAFAQDLGLEVVVETHTAVQVEAALSFGAAMIGINNRDLHTFTADLSTSVELAKRCPSGTLVISESGLSRRGDLEFLAANGIHACLIGESLITQPDLTEAVRSILPTTPQETE